MKTNMTNHDEIVRARKLLENNGYNVVKKPLKESSDDVWTNILESISASVNDIDNVTLKAQRNIVDILQGDHKVISNDTLSDSEKSYILNIYDKLLLLQDEISQIDDYIWRR